MRQANSPTLAIFVGKEAWGGVFFPCAYVIGGPEGPLVALSLRPSAEGSGYLVVGGRGGAYISLHPDTARNVTISLERAIADMAEIGPGPLPMPVWTKVRVYRHCRRDDASGYTDRTMVTIVVNREQRPVIRVHKAAPPGKKRAWGNVIFCDTVGHARTLLRLLQCAVNFIAEEAIARAH